MSQVTPSESATKQFINTTGGELAVLVGGATESSHPPVLFVPGYTGSKEDFLPLFDPLVERGLRVTALDLRGQHESAGPNNPAAYTVDALAADALEILDQLGEPAHVVGHSFGGLVCRAAAIARPSTFCSLTLLSSGPAAIGNNIRRQRMEAVAPLLETGGLAAVFDALEATDPGISQQSPELRAFLRQRFLASSPVGLQVMGYAAAAGEPDRVADLRATGVPLLVACGEADDGWPPEVQREMADRLGVSAIVIPGAVHNPAIENPLETVRVLIDFWKNIK